MVMKITILAQIELFNTSNMMKRPILAQIDPFNTSNIGEMLILAQIEHFYFKYGGENDDFGLNWTF